MSSGSSSSGPSSLYSIDKLNNTNFSSWKFRIQMVLTDRSLWEYVNGTIIPPVSDGTEAANRKLAEWKKKDGCALAQIALTVGNNELIHVKRAKTAAEAWTKICSVYEAKGLAAKIFLRRKFFNARLKEGDTMQAHVNGIRDLADQLDAIGSAVDDSDIAMTLLCSLPEDYESLIVALESRPPNELTSDFVADRLIDEEKRRSESMNVKLNGSSEAAFYGNYNNNNNNSAPRSGGGGSGNNNIGKGNGKKCSYCKKPNHTESTCYRKHGHPSNKGNNNNNTAAVAIQSNSNHHDVNDNSNDEFYGFTTHLAGMVIEDDEWVIDSGATRHFCPNREMFSDFQSISPTKVVLGNKSAVPAIGRGSIKFRTRIGNNEPVEIHLSDVFYVPDMGYNLLSIKRMTLDGWKVNFDDPTQCTISIKNSGQVLAIAYSKEGDLYRLKTLPMKLDNAAYITTAVTTSSTANNIKNITPIKLWHDRLGHLNLGSMNVMSNQQLVQDFDIKSITKEADTQIVTQCEACIKGKAHRATMPSIATHRATTLLELVHSDVCGPMKSESIGGARYFVTFIDDYSRFTVVKIMKTKSEVLEHFIAYLKWAENITNHRIKVFRSDNGGEYCSNDFNATLIQHGISRQLTPPYTPEHNGVAERANRTIVECARSMLHGANLDYSYWAEAVVTAVYLRNRSPSRSVQNVTPFEAWTNEKPSISHLKTFGCKCYAHIPKQIRTKLEPKAKECIFVGYPLESKAYRVYDPVDKRLFVSRDVTFLENQTSQSSASSNNTVDIIVDVGGKDDSPNVIQVSSNDSTMNRSQVIPSAIINNNVSNDNSNHDDEKKQESSRSNDSSGRNVRNRGPVQPYWILKDQRPPSSSSALLTTADNVQSDNIHETNAELLYALVSANNINDEPMDLNDAMQRDDSKLWEEAAQSEYDSIQAAGTWTLVPLPPDRKAIGSKWVFKIKRLANGIIDRYKARLVAKGFAQKEGVDYIETFAPVAKFCSYSCITCLSCLL